MSYRLYDYLPSGNGYKVRLVLRQLGLPYELVELDIKRGETRTPEFLAKNPNGRIPLLEIPGQGYLSAVHAFIHGPDDQRESNRIVFFIKQETVVIVNKGAP